MAYSLYLTHDARILNTGECFEHHHNNTSELRFVQTHFPKANGPDILTTPSKQREILLRCLQQSEK